MIPPTNPKPATAVTPGPASEVVVKIPLPRAPVEETPSEPKPVRKGPPPVPASAQSPTAQVPTSTKPQLRPAEPKLESVPVPPKPPQALAAPRTPQSIWAVRVGLLLTMGASLGLVYWSVFQRLLPATNQHREKALELTQVADELDRLRGQQTPQQVQEIKARYDRARSALVDPAQDLSEWEGQVHEQARLRILEATVERDPLKIVVPAAEELSALTAQVKIVPSPVYGSTNSPYGRLLKFTEALADSPKRLDLLELSVVGDSNSVSQATAVVQLFSAEGKPL